MKTKKGISMIILIITIVLVLILVSAITVTSGDSIENARVTAFAQDLKNVEEAVTLYYMQNDEFPVLGENKAYSKGEILGLVGARKSSAFVEELDLNNDNVENDNLGAFYLIDLVKLNVEETSRGIQKDADGNKLLSDVFAVSYPSMNVYYLEGVSTKNTVYFSLSSKISRVVKVSDIKTYTQNNAISTFNLRKMADVGKLQDVTVKREVKTWTNKLNLLIEANMESNETLYFSIGNSQMYRLDTSIGYNSIYFDDSFEKINLNSSENSISTGIDKAEIIEFNELEQADKKMYIVKESNGTIEGKVEIDLSNYDSDLPIRTTESEIVSNLDSNIVTFKVEDATSGVKEVKYEYLRKYDENATAKLYYEGVNEFDVSYMNSRGKSVKIDNDGTAKISVPKDVEGIQIRIFDKAGNASEIINLNTTTSVYIGINEKNPTKENVHLENVIKTNENIDYATIQMSTDGVNYTNEETINIVSQGNSIYTSSVDLENLVNVGKNIYVKLNVYYANNNIESRLKEITVYNTVENLSEGTRIKNESKYNRPYVPEEFKYLEGTVDTGYVIKDKTNGNEFVWVPVKDISEFKRGVVSDIRDITDYFEEENEINTSIFNSVLSHGGFYIGRYETRYKGEAIYDNTNEGTYLTGDISAVVNKQSTIWNYISNDYAKTVASNMYTGNTKSSLINSFVYDTTLNWIISTGNKTQEQVTVDSSSWGNYLDAIIENITSYLDVDNITTILSSNEPISKLDGESFIINTLNSNYTKANNIYDLAGNIYEWTTEMYDGKIIGRGGRYSSSGSERPATYRFTCESNDASNEDVGFRVMLYWE